MKKDQMELRLVPGTDPRFAVLVKELERYYFDRYGPVAKNHQKTDVLKDIFQVCLVVANGKAVACGAIQEKDKDTMLVKRVYVKPAYRRKGLAQQLMDVLELQALFNGYSHMALETGSGATDAVKLYTRLGYRVVESWLPFVGDDMCVCMGKDLEVG